MLDKPAGMQVISAKKRGVRWIEKLLIDWIYLALRLHFLTSSRMAAQRESILNYRKIRKNCIFQFSHSVMSDSLRPHEPKHTRPPCPSPTSRVHPNPCPSIRWCHPTISSSVTPFFSCLQSFPASGSFQMSQLFTSGGQSIRVSASTSVLPMNTQDWSP